MTDREMIIKGLYQHCEGSMFDRCGECPYYEVADEPFRCRDALLMDVLTLLKEQEPTKWISVKDRLPENGQQVVAISVGWFCDVVKFEERTGRWVGMECWYPTDRITHWMPLPEPPEEEVDNEY